MSAGEGMATSAEPPASTARAWGRTVPPTCGRARCAPRGCLLRRRRDHDLPGGPGRLVPARPCPRTAVPGTSAADAGQRLGSVCCAAPLRCVFECHGPVGGAYSTTSPRRRDPSPVAVHRELWRVGSWRGARLSRSRSGSRRSRWGCWPWWPGSRWAVQCSLFGISGVGYGYGSPAGKIAADAGCVHLSALSNSSRASSTFSAWASHQCPRVANTGSRLLPSSVMLYSTRGGISGW